MGNRPLTRQIPTKSAGRKTAGLSSKAGRNGLEKRGAQRYLLPLSYGTPTALGACEFLDVNASTMRVAM